MNNPGPQAPQEGATEPQNVTPTPSTGVVGAIAAKLEQKEQAQASTSESGVHAETPLPFDVTKLSKEQLQLLKAQLAVTPDQPQLRKQNYTARFRKIDGKYIIDFKTAYPFMRFDPVLRAEVDSHKIPVLFAGATEYVDILHREEFHAAPQVVCEILSIRTEPHSYTEGIVQSRETGLPRDMEVQSPNYYYTIKTPEGDIFEVRGEICNG